MAGLTLAASASAVDIKKNTAYRIVCSQYPQTSICLGNEHWEAPYIYSNQNYDGTCKDAWWYFEPQPDGSYAILNAETKQYVNYTTERINGVCKGLELADWDQGETSHWYIEDTDAGRCLIYTKAPEAVEKGDNYWNQRVNASDNYLLGTYTYATGPNSLFIITTDEYVGPEPGPGPEPEPEPEPEPTYTVVDGGSSFYAVGQTGNRLTIVPKDYVADYAIKDHTVTLTLAEGCYTPAADDAEAAPQSLVFTQATFFDLDALPADAEFPTFTSYKFNNKFNYQVFTDAEAADATLPAFTIPVGGIGKWLTASFQFSHEGAAAYIGETLQQSKVTRQRFDGPMTYTVGYPTWRRVEVRDYTTDADKAPLDIRTALMPYGSEQTVTIDWLCDRPTTEHGVPRIDILLTDHADAEWGEDNGWGGGWGGGWGWDEPEYFWLGQNGKTHYENAQITIDGGGTFPDMEPTPILIKGRGNSTWSQNSSSKNPYHFKFDKALKPLGMTKGKHWVLLCNKQKGSMTTNAIGHRVADMMGGVAPCHIVPVELYINDSYRGSYNLCEKVGFGNNCIALDDETEAAMVELDTYTDEKIYHDDWYYIATKMKEPDFDDEYDGLLDPDDIMADWGNLLEKAYNGESLAPYVDVERLAAYLAANEAICNCELKHAKSCFAYSENVDDGFSIEAQADVTPWVFGPLWDCDWAFGYEQQLAYFQTSQTEDYFGRLIAGGDSNGRAKDMWNALLADPAVNQAYYYKWYDFTTNRLPELLDFCDEYYDFAAQTLDHNTENETSQRDEKSDYAQLTAYAKQWLQTRAKSVLSKIKSYPLPEDPVEPTPVYDDPTGPIQGKLAGTIVGIDHQLADTDQTNAPADRTYDLHGRRTSAQTTIVVTKGQKQIR